MDFARSHSHLHSDSDKHSILFNTRSICTSKKNNNPISNICFPAGPPIITNQGPIAIEKINPAIHTIRGKKIEYISKTVSQDKHLICIEKDAIGKNVPSQKTLISINHKVYYNGSMIRAKELIDKFENVYRVKYNGEPLYNVIMEEHDKMIVNNLICETLHPENGIAKLYRILKIMDKEQQTALINCYNELAIKNKTFVPKRK
jgi:hypothetical protein